MFNFVTCLEKRRIIYVFVYLKPLSHLRFRSIAKSYFRRADGVLLLYDVTCEKSFLNVREWVDMIEVTHHSSAEKFMTDTVLQ